MVARIVRLGSDRAAGTGGGTAGHSGTPLARKLGLVQGSWLVAVNAPPDYTGLLAPLPAGVRFDAEVSQSTDLVHAFCTRRLDLQTRLPDLRGQIRPDAMVWVSWPTLATRDTPQAAPKMRFSAALSTPHRLAPPSGSGTHASRAVSGHHGERNRGV